MIRAPCRMAQHWLAILTLLLTVAVATPSTAQQTPLPNRAAPTVAVDTPFSMPVWQQTFYKTVTYQAVVNAVDLALFHLLIDGGTVATASFFAVNAVSAAALYYGFEYAWQTLDPPLVQVADRSLAEKTILFQTINTGRYFALGYAFGGDIAIATAFAAVNFAADTAIFVVNEYSWDTLQPR